ncbi:hypothetical protein [Streptomyces sp. NPDC018693]|uniref:hypothetical protein n=1 Tax=unclassified Streptomyces TaxID=2593676 RepID=UPI003790C955
MVEDREKAANRASVRGFLLSLTALCLAGATAWFVYVQFFTKGLEQLPDKLCEGTVGRNMVIQVLPSARSAEEDARHGNSEDDQKFSCHITTSGDSSLLGRSWVRPVSKANWLNSYEGGAGNGQLLHTSIDGVEALAQLSTEHAAVYISCAPPSGPSYNAAAEYGVFTEVEASGDTKTTGPELGQALTDIAYQLTKHVYKLAECQKPMDFPDQLPRYEPNTTGRSQ